MSLVRHLPIRDRVLYTALSFVEIAVFFGLSVLAFKGLYDIAVTRGLAVWVWIVAGAAYLLVVTIWWAPGEKEQNESELLAFVLFLVAALLAGGIYLEVKYHAVSGTTKTFVRILTTGG